MASETGNGDQSNGPNKVLIDPNRQYIIKTHRYFQSTVGSDIFDRAGFVSQQFTAVTPRSPGPRKAAKNPKPITLSEMDSEENKIFFDRILHLTLIEDPLVGFSSLHLIAVDTNGQATRLYIYQVPHDEETCAIYCFGQQLAIKNPFMRIAMDGSHGIRVDDPHTATILGKKTHMCRYCSKENAPHKCGRCKKVSYCNRECQVADWKKQNHKVLCRSE